MESEALFLEVGVQREPDSSRRVVRGVGNNGSVRILINAEKAVDDPDHADTS